MNTSSTHCKICDKFSRFIFTKKILSKYDVAYFKCQNCGFVQTEKPYWFAESYESALSALDTGLLARPLAFSQITEKLIMQYYNPNCKFVDYGGGNGIFVRLMRDKGFNFYRQDKYANNIYARFFDISDLCEEESKFDLLTSFEVLEHLENPLEALSEMFSYSENILCSTLLQPDIDINALYAWDYIGELHGQHISFYTNTSMNIIAERFGCYFYSNNIGLHLLTPKKLNNINFHIFSSNNPAYIFGHLLLKVINMISDKLGRNAERSHPPSLTLKDSEWVQQQFAKGRALNNK